MEVLLLFRALLYKKNTNNQIYFICAFFALILISESFKKALLSQEFINFFSFSTSFLYISLFNQSITFFNSSSI